MLKNPVIPKMGLRQILTRLWKTLSFSAISLYWLSRKISLRNLFYQKYLILPGAIGLLIALSLLETVWAIQGDNLGQQMLISRIGRKTEEITIEEGPANQVIQNSDFTIASIKDTQMDFTDPSTALGGAALISPDLMSDETPVMRTDIETYVVQPGDTIELIARKFAINVKSILWENKLTSQSIIRPGQELRILPVNGVTHKVKSGETLDKIAKYYKATVEDIVDFNNLADATDIFIGDLLIIPEGQLPPPPPPQKTRPKQSPDKTWLVEGQQTGTPEGENCHRFVPGQCTWYVAKKRCIPWTGHAKQWITNARRMGFTIGIEPAVGSIIAIRESWYGHVGYVESFDDSTVTFSEMNHVGPWVVDKRTLNRNDKRIIGYIY